MGRVGSAYDNSLAESFVATLKCELVHHERWPELVATYSRIISQRGDNPRLIEAPD